MNNIFKVELDPFETKEELLFFYFKSLLTIKLNLTISDREIGLLTVLHKGDIHRRILGERQNELGFKKSQPLSNALSKLKRLKLIDETNRYYKLKPALKSFKPLRKTLIITGYEQQEVHSKI